MGVCGTGCQPRAAKSLRGCIAVTFLAGDQNSGWDPNNLTSPHLFLLGLLL